MTPTHPAIASALLVSFFISLLLGFGLIPFNALALWADLGWFVRARMPLVLAIIAFKIGDVVSHDYPLPSPEPEPLVIVFIF